MRGRTYRYFDGEPLYPFGYGLSYTRFEYSDLRLDRNSAAPDSRIQSLCSSRTSVREQVTKSCRLYLRAIDPQESRSVRSCAAWSA